MSRNTNIVPSTRVRCARCSRFVFKSDTCRCSRRAPVYDPKTDGVMPHVRLTHSRNEPEIEVTVHHHGPLDENGNWSSWGNTERPAVRGDDL